MAILESVGQVDVEPPLVEEERDAFELLTRPTPHAVPGRPPGACGWVVSGDGGCLRLTDAEDVAEATAWLRYAVELLAERGEHRLSGLVAASRPSDGEMFTVRVTPQHRVYGKLLREARRTSPELAHVITLDEHRRPSR